MVPEDPGDGDPVELLAAGVRRFLDAVTEPARHLADHPAAARGHPRDRARARRDDRAPILERIEQLVRWAVKRSELPAELDVELAARAIRDLGEQAGRMVLTDPERYSPERYERFVQTVMKLLWPREPDVTGLTERSALAARRGDPPPRGERYPGCPGPHRPPSRESHPGSTRSSPSGSRPPCRRPRRPTSGSPPPRPEDTLPPLLGVPFTVKESIALAGMPQSGGLVARRGYRSPPSAAPVQRLIDAGAIPLGVTNTSELSLWIESFNRLYGSTRNPYDAAVPPADRREARARRSAAAGRRSASARTSAGRSGCRRSSAACSATSRRPGWSRTPTTIPRRRGEAAWMLGTGPLTRRAEDLHAAAVDHGGARRRGSAVKPATLGDPAAVSLEGLRVVTVEEATLFPMTRALRDARERAVGALAAAGAQIVAAALRSWRRAAFPFLATLQAGAGQTIVGLLEEAGAATPNAAYADPPRQPPHRAHPAHARDRAAAVEHSELAAQALGRRGQPRRRADEAIGDGVLLHPAYPRTVPRHGTTVGRPWLLASAAVFNLAGVPVTEVPLGSRRAGFRWASRSRPAPSATTCRSRLRSSSSGCSGAGFRHRMAASRYNALVETRASVRPRSPRPRSRWVSPRWDGRDTSRSATAEDFPDHSVDAMAARTHEVLDAAHAAGVRHFDAARSYGRAEEFLGQWLRAALIRTRDADDQLQVGLPVHRRLAGRRRSARDQGVDRRQPPPAARRNPRAAR